MKYDIYWRTDKKEKIKYLMIDGGSTFLEQTNMGIVVTLVNQN